MTVAELIERLQKLPSDTIVIAYDATEGFSELGPDGISYEESEFQDKDGKVVGRRRLVHLIGG